MFQGQLLPNSSRASGISCSGQFQLCRILRIRPLAPIMYLFVALARFLDPNGTVRRRINLQMENIEPVVMPDNVMSHFVLDALSDVDVGHDHPFAPHKGLA